MVRVLLHSLAFGTLKPFITKSPADAIAKSHMEMTLDVMANSLVYWVQDLVARQLMGRGGRIFAMTSAGGARVWSTYGAVSAAKAALESQYSPVDSGAGPLGITANAIMAGSDRHAGAEKDSRVGGNDQVGPAKESVAAG